MYRTRQPRYTSQHTSGHRQVVRHQLPKLTLAGSSPVARSRRSKSTTPFGCRAFFNKVPGLEPARVRALSKREAFVASRRRRRQAPEAGADLRSKYADVPLPAPWSKEDFGNGRFSPLCFHTSPGLGMPLKSVRICEANTRTSRCPLHRTGRFREWRSITQNVRLMPVAYTGASARYNGQVTTNVPIAKKEPL